MNDERLCALIASDPERGMRKLTALYSGLVLSILRCRLLKSAFTEADIEECAADVFTEFYLGIPGFDPKRGSVKARLAYLARRTAMRRIRLVYRQPATVPLEESAEGSPAEATPETELIKGEQLERLKQCVLKMDRPDRDVIIRKFWLGQSAREIARALKMSEGNVNTRTHRALKRLREAMEESNE